ncbi:MAG: glycine cleavage T C-terminal barrel domain-containing protein [Bdellovibrionota bacterium]
MEACYPLHGHELGDEISAIESGIGWTVKLNKGDFIGANVLKDHKENGAPRKLVGFFVVDRGIVREETPIFSEAGSVIGVCTSGTKTPTVGRALGLALINSESAKLGGNIFAEVRGKKLCCEIVKTPFYKRN